MFPEEFRQRITYQKYINEEALLDALEEPSPVSIRINPEKWDRKPVNAELVPWCETGFYLESRPSFSLDPLYHSGCYYPQEASGMFLKQVIKQTVSEYKDIRVLDLCGAPGGKSTHLSSLISPDSLLVANEVIRSRASVLAESVSKWGASNTIVTNSDPVVFGRLSGFFDLILVDAPCSGEGMFRDNIAVRQWSVENTVLCSQRQKRILRDVWPALKENGILIYSTCTFNPSENEQVVEWLTNNEEAENVRLDISEFREITRIDYRNITGYGFYPDKIKGEGFFVSVIRKTGKSGKTQIRNRKKTGDRPGKPDLPVLRDWTTLPDQNLLRNGNEIISVAGRVDDYLFLAANLNIIKGGIRVCTVKKKNYLPSHELALSKEFRKGSFPHSELDYHQAVDYLHRESFVLSGLPKGWFIVTYKGVNLGFANNLGSRINNYYPVNWRIRMRIPELRKDDLIKWD